MTPAPGQTTGEIARRNRCGEHHVRKIFTRGILPEPPRIGPFRFIPADMVDQVEAELRKAGYVAAESEDKR